jgi:hypothetical protein
MVANLFEKGADVDSRDEVRIDMFVGPMYRLGLLCVIPLNFTRHNVNMAEETRLTQPKLCIGCGD